MGIKLIFISKGFALGLAERQLGNCILIKTRRMGACAEIIGFLTHFPFEQPLLDSFPVPTAHSQTNVILTGVARVFGE